MERTATDLPRATAVPARRPLVLTSILLVAAALRLWGLRFGLPHPLARPDEEVVLRTALGFFGGDFDPHFFQWPSLFFYAVHGCLRAVYVVGWFTGHYASHTAFRRAVAADPAWAYLLMRALSVASSLATVGLVAQVGTRLGDRPTGLLAAGALTVAFLAVRDAHFGVLESALTLAILVAVASLSAARRSPRPIRAFVWAGVATGLALSLRYNAAALVVAGLVTVVVRWRDDPDARREAGLAGLAFLAAAAGAFVAGTPYALLDAHAFANGLALQAAHVAEGHGSIAVGNPWARYLTFVLPGALGWPLYATGLAGMAWLVVADRRKAAVLWTFPCVYGALLGTGGLAFVRYATPLVPFLCLGAAFAVRRLAAASHAPVGAVAAAVCLLVAPTVLTDVRFDRLLARPDSRVVAADWLAAHLVPGDSVYESGSDYVHIDLAWPAAVRASVNLVPFDEVTSTFPVLGARADWVVVAESALRPYVDRPAELPTVLASEYDLVETVTATTDTEREAWFDRQDAFFLPYTDLGRRERPGPTLRIYRLRRR